MDLRTKIKASSIAEVVIALTIIALCFGVASLVFIRSLKGTIRFYDFKQQTEIQSEIYENLIRREHEANFENFLFETTTNEPDSVIILDFIGSDNRIIWQQEWEKEN